MDNQGDKEETFMQTGRRGGDVSQVDRTPGKTAAAGGPSEVVDCGAGWAKLQLAGKAAAGGQGDRLCNPEFQLREIKPQFVD